MGRGEVCRERDEYLRGDGEDTDEEGEGDEGYEGVGDCETDRESRRENDKEKEERSSADEVSKGREKEQACRISTGK